MKAGIGTEVESDVEVEMEIKRKRVREAELRIEIVFSSPTLWKDSPSAQKKKKRRLVMYVRCLFLWSPHLY